MSGDKMIAGAAGDALLVVDDEALGDRLVTLREVLAPAWEILHARAALEAVALTEQGAPVSIVMLEVDVPAALGPVFVSRLRRRRPGVLIAVLAPVVDRDLLRQANDLGVTCLIPGDLRQDVSWLAALARARQAATHDRVADGVRAFAHGKGLGPSRRCILHRAVAGASRKQIAGALGLSEETVKTSMDAIRARCGYGARRFEELVADLREAILAPGLRDALGRDCEGCRGRRDAGAQLAGIADRPCGAAPARMRLV